jgi:uroporphyrinogen decarboxylase
MIPKERVLATIGHKPTDTIPCDFRCTPTVQKRLCQELNIPDMHGLLTHFGSDMVDIRGTVDPLWAAPFSQVTELPGGVRHNYLGFLQKVVSTQYGELFEHCDYILKDAEDISDIKDFRWPSADWFDFGNMARELAEYENLAIMASGASVFQHPTLVRRLDQLLCDMAVNQGLAHFIMDKYTDYYLDWYERLYKAAPGLIDIMLISDDFGMQDKPLISLEMAREFVFPRIKKLAALSHAYGVKVMMHSCGSVDVFIDDMIASGVDVLDPLQPLAANMDAAGLKQRFGGRIAFHGSIDTQYTLPRGSPEDVRKEVQDRMNLFGNEGGFILAPAHVLQPDVPTANIEALYQTVHGGKS